MSILPLPNTITDLPGFRLIERELPRDKFPVPVYIDRYVSEADHIIIVNRVKIHTDFHDRFESGLMKRMAIGLGKQTQVVSFVLRTLNKERNAPPEEYALFEPVQTDMQLFLKE